MAFFQFKIVLAAALTFSSIALSSCSEVKGTVSCTDCGSDYDFTGIRVLVKCDQVNKLSEAITDQKGHFEAILPSASSTASTSPKCLAKLLGGTSQLYALKQNMVSEIIMARGDENSYTVSTPLVFSKSCHGKCGSRGTSIDSSKTYFGLPPASFFAGFLPIIGVP